ncbi:MAG: lysine--tRNA ligase [Planctomycetota bacterium]|jgi:lysyl-tRNA synthetase class 2|nr:lysine--tRNA ligase [Planctomycetota bacterium]
MANSKRIREERLGKLNLLREKGIPPYGDKVKLDGDLAAICARCPESADGREEKTPPLVTAAGRISAIRNMGKSCWLDLRDRSGKIQVNLIHKRMPETFSLVKLLDIGDFIAVSGQLHKSRTGEITIFADTMTFQAKNLEPLPAKFKGLRDVEIRFRRRYLDLVANEDSRARFILRSRIISHIRSYLDRRGFLEVETPMLQPIYGGAAARPFTTRHHALDMDLYLRISPETYLKRLLVGGLDRVYELNRNFRNEGIDTSHNPEFTMIELYQAYADFTDMMELLEDLVSDTAKVLLGTTRVNFAGQDIDVSKPWPRKRIHDLIRESAACDPGDDESLRSRLAAAGMAGEKVAALSHDYLIKEIMDEVVEPKLIQPTIVTHHPASLNPLCRLNRRDPSLSDRFEAIVAGFELANAFSELNDPLEQKARFEKQLKLDRGREESYGDSVDEDYVSALEVGMPPAGGMGLGIDRLVMLLTGQASIREVILFPTLKPKSREEIETAMEESLPEGTE